MSLETMSLKPAIWFLQDCGWPSVRRQAVGLARRNQEVG